MKAFVKYKYPNSPEQQFYGMAKPFKLGDDWPKKGFLFMPFNDAELGYVIEPVQEHFSVESTPLAKVHVENKDTYMKNVNQLIETLQSDPIVEKVVYARAFKTTIKSKVEVLFSNLKEQHQNALIYWVQIENVGEWVGATPEPLFVSKKGIMNTVALAGTRHINDMKTEPFTAKEEIEQEVVKNYIENIFKNLGVDYSVSDRHEYQAGKLIHLRNTFEAVIPENKSAEIIDQLHPTPAVSGLPKQNAINYILNNETLNRSFYAGYLGLVENGNYKVYVNLRCAQVINDDIYIYVGGGINKQSVAEDEWQETVNKSSTILNAMK